MCSGAADPDDGVPATERVNLRLRRGDRRRVDARAAARNMKPASYLVALIRAHVRQNGTRYAWHNKSAEPCRMLFCVIGAHRR